MKLIRTLTMTGLLSALTACSASTRSDDLKPIPPLIAPVQAPQLAQPDASLTKDCPLPVDIGSAALTQSPAEKNWTTDRKNLLDCGRGKHALVEFYRRRDTALGNGGPH